MCEDKGFIIIIEGPPQHKLVTLPRRRGVDALRDTKSNVKRLAAALILVLALALTSGPVIAATAAGSTQSSEGASVDVGGGSTPDTGTFTLSLDKRPGG